MFQIYGLKWNNKISMYRVKIFVVLDQHNVFNIKGQMQESVLTNKIFSAF